MGEGNHLPAGQRPGSMQRMWLIFGGTALAVVAGLVLMQTYRANPGQAAPEQSTASAKGAQKKSMDILAKVGGEPVPYDLVASECVARYGKEVLDDIIHRMVIQQACKEKGVAVTDEEVSAEVARVAKRFNLDPPSWYQMLQAERNITPLQYRQSVIWPMLALKKLAGEEVDVTEEDLNKAFVRNYGSRVKCRLILLDNQRRANECWNECSRVPEDFEKLAQKYSIDPSSRPLGGTIPPIPRYSGNDVLEAAAFKLKPDEISGIIELQTGRYAILKCEGRTEQVVDTIDDVRDSLYEELVEQKTQQSVAMVFEQIKKNSRVDNYLTQTSSGPDRSAPSAVPGGIQPVGAQRPATANSAGGKATLRR